jgi:DNA-binding transcriptional LysR family regulator
VVERIDGIGMAVRSALREGFDRGEFVALEVPEPRVELPYVLTYRSGVRLLPVVDRFREVLMRHVGRL